MHAGELQSQGATCSTDKDLSEILIHSVDASGATAVIELPGLCITQNNSVVAHVNDTGGRTIRGGTVTIFVQRNI